jgi:hypothetical protein
LYIFYGIIIGIGPLVPEDMKTAFVVGTTVRFSPKPTICNLDGLYAFYGKARILLVKYHNLLAAVDGEPVRMIGLDSGPIHVAGTTSVPIVCGFTNVAPEHRYPIRDRGIFMPIVPDLPCSHCQSRWCLNYHDFGYCYFKHADCIKQMTADKFIKALGCLDL